MIDKSSDTWATILAWTDEEATKAISRLTNTGCSLVETEYLRGRLATLAELSLLGNDADPPLAEPTEDYGLQGVDEGFAAGRA